MGDAEPRSLRSVRAVDEDPALAAGAVGQENAFAPIQHLLPDLSDPETHRDLVRGHRSCERADLSMQCLGKPVWRVDVGKVDPI